MGVPPSPATQALLNQGLNVVGRVCKTSKYKFADWNLKLPKNMNKIPESEFKKLGRAAQFFREGHYTTEDIKKIQADARLAKEAEKKAKEATKLAKESSKLAKESKKVIEKAKKVAEDSKKVIDTILKKVPGGNVLEKASKVSSMYGVFAIIGVQAGITAFAAWVSNFVQDTQDKYLEQLSADLTKANGRALANTALIRKQQEQINRLNADIKAKTDKIYAEAAGASKNATVAREKANDALYEARQGRKIVEEKIATANKKANDALYETRTGRTKLEEKISKVQAEVTKFSQSATGNFQTQINLTIGLIQKTLQETNSRVATSETKIAKLEQIRPTFQDKVIQTTQDAVKKVSTDLGAAVVRLAQLEKLPTEVKTLQSQVKTIEVEHPKKWGITVTQAEVRQAQVTKSTNLLTVTSFEAKLATVTRSQFSASEWVGRYGKRTADLVDNGVDNLNVNDKVLADTLTAATNNLDQRIKKLEREGLQVSDPAVGMLLRKVNSLQADLDKATSELNQTRKNIDQLNIKTKEQEKVNQQALPKLDQILGFLPLIPGRAAAAIRPDIPTIPQIETASATGTCRTLQPGGCSRKAFDDLGNGINQNVNNQSNNLFDKLNAGANAAQLALLKVIDNKLGAQLPGGLSATFGRLWQMLQVDRVISVLTYIAVVHNALMLSNNIFQTLFSAFDNIAQFAGFKWKNEKDDEVGFGALVNEWIGNGLKAIFGEETIKNASKVWNAANRIYQAAANIAGLVQSIQQSILTALEVVGAGVSKIANALKACGAVFEKAYEWMNPQPNFDNTLFRTLGKLQETASNIETVSQTPLSIKSSIEGMQAEKQAMAEALKDGENGLKGLGIIESEKQTVTATKRKEESQGKNLENVDKIEGEDDDTTT